MNLLYLDLLGTKKKWEQGGRRAVEAAFATFEALVQSGLAHVSPAELLQGGIEADSAAIVCADGVQALRLSQAILTKAFNEDAEDATTRLWIRGAIVPVGNPGPLRATEPMDPPFANIAVHRYSAPLLEAISVERSGFKGMRILIADALVNDPLREAMRIPVGPRHLIPLRRLDHSRYRVEGFQDWLWMLPRDENEWTRAKRQMAARLRWAAADADEFLQAAATQVVFHESEAIWGSLRTP
jgi:hypothetical protein